MKRVLTFILLALVLDRGVGAILSRVQRRTMTGDRGRLVHALTRDAQILILGSSRAEYQIVPSILHQRLGLSVFNAGLKGQDFLCAVMLLDLWKTRHPFPRAIVLSMDVESMIERPTEVATAHMLAPYLDESKRVRDILYSDGPFKRWEYLSRAYRFNGDVFGLLNHAFQRPPPDFDGFATSPGALDPMTDKGVLNALDQDATAIRFAERPFSAQKIGYLRELASEVTAHGSQLVLIHTPLFRQDDRAHDIWVTRLKLLIGNFPAVTLVDLCTETRPTIFSNPGLYRNLNHLNVQGAEILTGMLADEMTKLGIKG